MKKSEKELRKLEQADYGIAKLFGGYTEEVFHLFVEEASAGTIRLDPFAVENELRDGTLAGVRDDLVGGAGCGFDVDVCVWNCVLGEEALGFGAVAAPGDGVDSKCHTSILRCLCRLSGDDVIWRNLAASIEV